ncbi:MAG: J domain-containing protein [Brevundimonas sp.]|uniref:DnaJ C-terminal domain-containing protein n=1 Tax=Brevundimonas sp. TaxID=1871086 RepID=UPI0025B8D044|nr:DnaJ C-terminal domain-containing protein [Brevundimonas sp.]MBX3477694.1 J domain-containing protein [Brevundimonas sp.]
MPVAGRSEIASLKEAYALIGLNGPVEGPALTAAFRAAVKAARPDREDGDADRFRRVIAAWRLIQKQAPARPALAAPAARPAPPPILGLTPMQAVAGGGARITVGGRRLRIRVPAGLRTGEHLRLKGAGPEGDDLYLPVRIRPEDGLSAFGDDLFMDWPCAPRLFEDGGRIEIDTWSGPRSAWMVGGVASPYRVRLRGLGLPARGSRPQGHLFVTLTPAQDAPSAAEDLLARFSRVWTPGRMAA